MARKNTQKKITFMETHTLSDGEGAYQQSRSHTAIIGTEDDYIKIYFRGLEYLRDIPKDCFALLCELLQLTTYAAETSNDGYNYSFVIDMTPLKREMIARNLGYKGVASVNNLLTQLLDGEVIQRMTPCVYRLNPYFFGRGAFSNIVELRSPCNGFSVPDDKDTFMSTYNRNVKNKRSKKQEEKKRKAQQAAEETDSKYSD